MKTKLIEDNIGLVYSLISREYPQYIQDEDIIQSGMLGLCKAAEQWDESKSKFSNYAWYCIRNEIIKEFRDRNKHKGILSLDYDVQNDGGEKTSLVELIVGDEDVNYVDVSVDLDRLNEKERQVYELLVEGIDPSEITRRLNVPHQFITWTKRKLRLLRQREDRKG